ncbi:hypothetical protein GCM10009739_23150 [Microbacterium ulmi]
MAGSAIAIGIVQAATRAKPWRYALSNGRLVVMAPSLALPPDPHGSRRSDAEPAATGVRRQSAARRRSFRVRGVRGTRRVRRGEPGQWERGAGRGAGRERERKRERNGESEGCRG